MLNFSYEPSALEEEFFWELPECFKFISGESVLEEKIFKTKGQINVCQREIFK